MGSTSSSPVGVPTVTGNTVTGAGSDAIVVASASIDMGKLNGNSGSGNGLNGVQLGVGHRDGQLVAAVDAATSCRSSPVAAAR